MSIYGQPGRVPTPHPSHVETDRHSFTPESNYYSDRDNLRTVVGFVQRNITTRVCDICPNHFKCEFDT